MDRPWFFLSLHDKESYRSIVEALDEMEQFRFAGTDGTSDWCRSLGIDCEPMSEWLDMDPGLDGQVKSLHPDLYKGILGSGGVDGVANIEGVLVDLTPFDGDNGINRKKIDIGGVSLLRAAVKHHTEVIPLADPESAQTYVDNVPPSEHARQWLASRALRRTLAYDKQWLGEMDDAVGGSDRAVECSLPAYETLRYGENPSQEAHYRHGLETTNRGYDHLGGDDLSYTNLLDVRAVDRLVDGGTDALEVAVVKHTNPTGWARGKDVADTLEAAWEGDPKSAFGGVMGLNKPVDESLLELIDDWFVEVLVAPGFSPEIVQAVDGEDRPRLVRSNPSPERDSLQSLGGNYLTQTTLQPLDDVSGWSTEAGEVPEDRLQRTLEQMWRICARVTSNAVVMGTHDRVLSVGAGQQSRVDAVRLAATKLEEHHPSFDGPLVMASDGFFPFPDNVEFAGDAGVDAIVSPGGSVKDEEVLQAARDHDITMVFTGQRVFRH